MIRDFYGKPIRRKRLGAPRRGRIVDKEYLAWLHKQPGVVHGGKTHSVHHIRFYGSPKNDRETLPMELGFHQVQEGPLSIEALGKTKWQEFHGVDIWARIRAYQVCYLREHPQIKWEGVDCSL